MKSPELSQPWQLQVLPTGSGLPSLLADGSWVHSSRDPRREAEKVALTVGGSGPIFIFGFGLGYLAEEVSRRFPERSLIVFESQVSVFNLAQQNRDLGPLLGRANAHFFIGLDPDHIIPFLDEILSEVPDTPVQRMYNRLLYEKDSPWYRSAEEALNLWFTKSSINEATLKRFGKRWVKNLSANLSSIRDFPGISGLQGLFQGFPALVVAAGPTLDDFLPLLPDLSRRCVVIAVDTALRALLNLGVKPDFVVVVDPQFWNFKHLDRCPAPESFLITESAVYPSVFRHPFRRTFLGSSFFPLGRFVENRLEIKGELGAGGSVATTAWDFARLIGANPILMGALDLSFPGLKTHFRGALFEERAHQQSTRFLPAETQSVQSLRDAVPFWASDLLGKSVLTDKRMTVYAAWFQNRFAQFPDVSTLRLSAHSLAIPGSSYRSPQDFLSGPVRRSEIDAILDGIDRRAALLSGNPRIQKQRTRLFNRALDALINGLREIETLALNTQGRIEEACLRLKTPGTVNGDYINSLLDDLDQSDQRIRESSVKEVVAFLFPRLSENDNGAQEDKIVDDGISTEIKALLKHLRYSSRLYRELYGNVKYHLDTLLKFSKVPGEPTDINSIEEQNLTR
jgi:hypothetical protein